MNSYFKCMRDCCVFERAYSIMNNENLQTEIDRTNFCMCALVKNLIILVVSDCKFDFHVCVYTMGIYGTVPSTYNF